MSTHLCTSAVNAIIRLIIPLLTFSQFTQVLWSILVYLYSAVYQQSNRKPCPAILPPPLNSLPHATVPQESLFYVSNISFIPCRMFWVQHKTASGGEASVSGVMNFWGIVEPPLSRHWFQVLPGPGW